MTETNAERLAQQTCHRFLSARDLKAICRVRGFNPPKGDKAALAAFVAPRLLTATGVAEAVGSLEEPWLLVLHCMAMAAQPLDMDDVFRIAEPARRAYDTDHRARFRQLADGLLSRGVALVEEAPGHLYGRKSRFARVALHFPEAHRPFLAPYPVPTMPLGQGSTSGQSLRFCRRALQAAVRRVSRPGDGAAGGLLGGIAAAISVQEAGIRIAGTAITDLPRFLHQVRSQWTKSYETKGGRSKTNGRALGAAEHILSHLPPQEGVGVAELTKALARIGVEVREGALARFCEEGHQAGFLVQGPTHGYASAPDREALSDDGPLAFTASDDGIDVDLEQSGLGPLLELTTVSRVRVAGDRLHLGPDIIRMGRSAPRLGSLASLSHVRAASPVFEKAVKHVAARHGRLLLHEGLVLLRVEDIGLRAVLSHHMGERVRSLGGAYLAVPHGLVDAVEKLARKEGFAPRRVS